MRRVCSTFVNNDTSLKDDIIEHELRPKPPYDNNQISHGYCFYHGYLEIRNARKWLDRVKIEEGGNVVVFKRMKMHKLK